jgi:multidrug efflux pump subunit AcrA (membrane-fusion protein)
LAGRISGISQIPISPGMFDCQLRVDDKAIDNRIVPGMKCSVKLLAYEKQEAITIPLAGLHTDSEGKDYVDVVVKDGEPVKRIVVVGKRTDKKVEIRRGLKAGDEILLPKADGDGK